VYLIRIKLIRFLIDKYKININYDLSRTFYSKANFTYATSSDPFSLQRSKSRYFDNLLIYVLKRLHLSFVFFKIFKIVEYFFKIFRWLQKLRNN